MDTAQSPHRLAIIGGGVMGTNIAALATGTVIIEAGSRSGAMTAARHARDLGRPVMAVPGPVTSDTSSGCHELIQRRQAVLVTCAGDVVNTLQTAPVADG